MAERKVFNKYIPPDFDPRLLAKFQGPKNGQMRLRNMLPMTLCCRTCGSYMGRGTKFNSRQEIAPERTWKGIKVWRFYVRCSTCCAEMTFVTDPERDHYLPEHGCTSMTEPWKAKEEAIDSLKKEEKRILEESDSMTSLDYRAKIQREQLELLDSIDELRTINARQARVDTDAVIDALAAKRSLTDSRADDEHIEEEMERFREIRHKKRRKQTTASSSSASSGLSLFSHSVGSGLFSFGGTSRKKQRAFDSVQKSDDAIAAKKKDKRKSETVGEDVAAGHRLEEGEELVGSGVVDSSVKGETAEVVDGSGESTQLAEHSTDTKQKTIDSGTTHGCHSTTDCMDSTTKKSLSATTSEGSAVVTLSGKGSGKKVGASKKRKKKRKKKKKVVIQL